MLLAVYIRSFAEACAMKTKTKMLLLINVITGEFNDAQNAFDSKLNIESLPLIAAYCTHLNRRFNR